MCKKKNLKLDLDLHQKPHNNRHYGISLYPDLDQKWIISFSGRWLNFPQNSFKFVGTFLRYPVHKPTNKWDWKSSQSWTLMNFWTAHCASFVSCIGTDKWSRSGVKWWKELISTRLKLCIWTFILSWREVNQMGIPGLLPVQHSKLWPVLSFSHISKTKGIMSLTARFSHRVEFI